MDKSEILKMAATIVAGILSNPACGVTINDSWNRQQLICQVIQEIINTVNQVGIVMEDK